MAIYNITSQQLKGTGILNSFEMSGVGSFSNTRSLLFDGTDDFVQVANDASINFDGEFSVSMWFKTTSSNVMYAITHGSSSEIKYLIQFYAPINRIRLQIFDVSNVSTIIDNTQVFNDGQWHHLAFTTDGTTTSDKVIVYFDGSPLTNKGTLSNNGIRLTTLSLSIGQVPNTARFNGNIDEVALFNSELSSTDITSIYNGNGAGKPGDLASLNPVSWWRFEEGSGTTATDSGTGGNNGTLLGGPTYSTDVPS